MTLDTNCSDSLEAVPFPIAIILILFFNIKSINLIVDPSISFCGSVGYKTAVSNTFPVSSITANLHPVLYAGSKPSTVYPFNGAPSNNCFAFLPNTSIAWISALSVKSDLISLSNDGSINLFQESAIVAFNSSFLVEFFIIMAFSKSAKTFSSGFVIFTFSNFSFSPLFIASILWLGIVFIFSENS